MWIKRREYEELKKVRSKYVDVMKAIHSAENGKITRCNFGVFMPNNVYDYYVDLIANLNKEVKDIKEKNTRPTSKFGIL